MVRPEFTLVRFQVLASTGIEMSSGVLHRVVWYKWIDVSEVLTVSVNRAEGSRLMKLYYLPVIFLSLNEFKSLMLSTILKCFAIRTTGGIAYPSGHRWLH